MTPKDAVADDPHAEAAGLPDQGALALPALGAGLGVAGGDHDQALDVVLAALGDRPSGSGSAGTATTARSTSQSMSRTERKAGTPSSSFCPSGSAPLTA
ncbi:hypothetical protein SALBM217S_04241 [Streptomyces griseoloalbus]